MSDVPNLPTRMNLPSTKRRIGAFEIHETLRPAELGAIYFGYDQNTGKLVHLYILDHELAADNEFQQKIRHLAIDPIEGLAPIEDFDQVTGIDYLAIPQMPGGSMEMLLQQGTLMISDVVNIINRLGSAMDHAHAMGLFHSHLTPSEIFFDEHGQAVLAGMGYSGPTGSLTLSKGDAQSFVNLLDPALAYAAPELVQGTPPKTAFLPSSLASMDIYALAAVGFTMLEGHPPGEGETFYERIHQRLAGQLGPFRMIGLNKRANEAVQMVFETAMSVDPAKRYQTAADFGYALYRATILPPLDPKKHEFIEPFDPVAVLIQPENRRKRKPKIMRWALMNLIALLVGGALVGFRYNIFSPQLAVANIAAGVDNFVKIYTITWTPPPLTATMTATRTSTPQFTPTDTGTATVTPTTENTATPTPKATQTLRATAAPLVIGMADKIAYIKNRNIYMANIDGSGETILLDMTEVRRHLRWTPDGSGLLYEVVSGLTPQGHEKVCQYFLPVLDNRGGTPVYLGCFGDLAIFPDMTRAIFSGYVDIGNSTEVWRSYIGTYDLNLLKSFLPIPTEPVLGGCNFTEGGWHTMISDDMTTFAAIMRSGSREILKVFKYRGSCNLGFETIDILPGHGFQLTNQNSLGDLTEFGWDGKDRIVMHGNYKNTGYGDLFLYNLSDWEGEKINPVRDLAGGLGQCCYQDIQFSPDGKYLLFVFRDNRKTEGPQVYYIDISTLDSQIVYQPLNLRTPFSNNRDDRVEPALREYRPARR